MLVEFASVVDAVRCAVEVQRAMAAAQRGGAARSAASSSASASISATSSSRSDDIFGDGVNVAARLEGLAEPGGICVSVASCAIRSRDKLDFAFEDMGEQQVKNIARPVRVYRVRAGNEQRPSRAAAAAAPRQAVDRGAALRQYERRPGAGIFRRRHGRGDHHRALPHPLAVRHRPQFDLHLQGPRRRREAGRARTRRALCAGRLGAQGRQRGCASPGS